MKKILFILTNLAGGGAEKVLIDVLSQTDYSCYKVDLLLIVGEGVYLSSVPSAVQIHSLYKSRGFKYKLDFLLARYFGLEYFQRHLLKKKIVGRYDVVASFMEGIPLKFHKYLLSDAQRNITWVHTDLCRLHYTSKYFKRREELRLYNSMDAVVVVSNQAREGFYKQFQVEVPLFTLYNPINKTEIVSLAGKQNIATKKFTICCVGRLTYAKRLDRALRVVDNLLKKGYEIELWIVGCGQLEKQLLKLCNDLGIKKNVSFLGFQSNPYPYIKAADIFLSTSMTEGYPLVICEALCLDKPIVATNVTGPREILGDSEFGLLTEESDEAIFEGVRRMIDDKDLRQHYAEIASERKQMFDIQSTVDKIYKLINSDAND